MVFGVSWEQQYNFIWYCSCIEKGLLIRSFVYWSEYYEDRIIFIRLFYILENILATRILKLVTCEQLPKLQCKEVVLNLWQEDLLIIYSCMYTICWATQAAKWIIMNSAFRLFFFSFIRVCSRSSERNHCGEILFSQLAEPPRCDRTDAI